MSDMMKLITYFALVFSATALALAGETTDTATEAPEKVLISSNTPTMEKYSVITEKNLFNELEIPDPPSAQLPGPLPGAMAAFGKDYELKALIDTGTSGIRAGFFDKKANNNFYISEGEAYDGLELVSVNYDNEEAVLQRGGETCSFSLRPDKSKPAATTPALPGMARPPPTTARPATTPNLPFKPEPGNTAYRGKTIEQFLKDHPEAAKQANSPIRVSAPNFKAFGKGMSIDQFLKEHPDAMSQFPSPIQPIPSGDATGISKGEAIDRMMRQAQQGAAGMPASPGTPPAQVPGPEPETITPLPPAPAEQEITPAYPDGTETQ